MPLHTRKPTETPSGNCAVESGLPCLVPDQRKKLTRDWTINMPNIISILGILGALCGYAINNERRMTENAKDKEVLALVDKGIVDHQQIMDELAKRDRSEMKEDIKQTKEMVSKIYERQHR